MPLFLTTILLIFFATQQFLTFSVLQTLASALVEPLSLRLSLTKVLEINFGASRSIFEEFKFGSCLRLAFVGLVFANHFIVTKSTAVSSAIQPPMTSTLHFFFKATILTLSILHFYNSIVALVLQFRDLLVQFFHNYLAIRLIGSFQTTWSSPATSSWLGVLKVLFSFQLSPIHLKWDSSLILKHLTMKLHHPVTIVSTGRSQLSDA